VQNPSWQSFGGGTQHESNRGKIVSDPAESVSIDKTGQAIELILEI